MLGAVNENGYGTLTEAAEKMKQISGKIYIPNLENTEIYTKLYKQYETLSEYFANSENSTMDILKNLN